MSNYYPSTTERLHGRSLESFFDDVSEANRQAIDSFLTYGDHQRRIDTAPGSRNAHHDWLGGYKEHVRQTFVIASANYQLMEQMGLLEQLPDEEQFTLSDALTVMFLHDIEKPFIYEFNQPDGEIITRTKMTKADRKTFRKGIIDTYGFHITPTMENALLHVEGVRDEYYVPGERADQPLAALCHAADNLSARGFYSYKGK